MAQAPIDPMAGDRFDPGMVSHLRVVTGLIEGRRVGHEEILELLREVVRQHSMEHPGNVVYGMCHWNGQPP